MLPTRASPSQSFLNTTCPQSSTLPFSFPNPIGSLTLQTIYYLWQPALATFFLLIYSFTRFDDPQGRAVHSFLDQLAKSKFNYIIFIFSLFSFCSFTSPSSTLNCLSSSLSNPFSYCPRSSFSTILSITYTLFYLPGLSPCPFLF